MSADPITDRGGSFRIAPLWRLAITSEPGRLENTVRVVVLVLIVITISETFRIPEAGLSAYIVLFLSRAEAASTAITALIAGIAAVLAIVAVVVAFMISLSEPALRIPMIASATFVAMFLARTGGELAPALFAAGFIVAYGLTLGDDVLGFAMMPGPVVNTASFTVPELAFIPPEEALLHFLLWLALVATMPVALVIIGNLLTGRQPSPLLRAAMRERLRAAAGFCEDLPGAEGPVSAMAFEGTGALLKLQHLSSLLRKPLKRAPIAEIQQLLLQLLAVRRVTTREIARVELAPVARFCREAARALAREATPLPDAPEITLTGTAAPLTARLRAVLQAIREPPGASTPRPTGPRSLLAPDAFRDPEHVQFALKVTLAVMLCYFVQSMLDWPGIHTCVITCFFVSLGTIGDTAHKAALRLLGCLIGGALGIGTILLLMPLMTDLGDLLLVVAVVTLIAAWIGFGSDRISYAGWQIGMAFYLSTFQGFGPTLDMEAARDRIVGIMLGNVVIFVIFTTIWPVRVTDVARRHLVAAMEHLSALFQAGASAADETAGFAEAMRDARAAMANEPLESRMIRHQSGQELIDRTVLVRVQALLIPILVVLDLLKQAPVTQGVAQYVTTLGLWFHRAAAWIRDGSGTAGSMPSLVHPPDADEPLQTWFCVLDQDINEILMEAGPAGRSSEAHLTQVLRHASN